jgi:hypothetical protein
LSSRVISKQRITTISWDLCGLPSLAPISRESGRTPVRIILVNLLLLLHSHRLEICRF